MADKYIYAVARIRALEMTLMSQAVIEQLVATDSYKKAVQFIIEKAGAIVIKPVWMKMTYLGRRLTDVGCCG